MAARTLNQIWKDFAEKKGVTFKEWIGVEKHLYTKKSPSITFENWANKRYAVVGEKFLNFDWNNIKDFLNDNKDEIGTAAGALAGEEAEIGGDETPTTPKNDATPPTDNKIFGMPKVLAIGVGVVALAGITFGIVKIVKSIKK